MTGATTYHHHDGLGSVIMLTNASGSVVERYRYDVFGHVTILDTTQAPRPATAHTNRFLFTGREWIGEIGIYDYRNRIYWPELGRFLQTDPIRFEAGDVNLYRYVFNNSVNWVDPEGLQGARKVGRRGNCCIKWTPMWEVAGFSSWSECMTECMKTLNLLWSCSRWGGSRKCLSCLILGNDRCLGAGNWSWVCTWVFR
jgi:RHS repeat-associated protein